MDHVPQSPYLRALGDQRPGLHPALSTYFSPVPRGSVGIGEGVFERVGTPRRWLWPVLRMLQGGGAVLAGWHEQVPFTIRNRTIAGRAVSARTLHLPDGDWTMKDTVTARSGGRVIDQIGEPTTLAVAFDVAVDEHALTLRSTAMGVRLAGVRVRIQAGLQRVELTVDAPLIGRIYEYAGTFTFRVEQEQV